VIGGYFKFIIFPGESKTSSDSTTSAQNHSQTGNTNADTQPVFDQETHYISYINNIQPILEEYCYNCHMDGSEKGYLDLDKYTNFASMTQDRETWVKIKEHLEYKLMPPVDKPQPKTEETATINDWIDNSILYTDPDNPDPGKVVLRRLNRNEYQNTIYDLLGVTINVEHLLPLDDTGYGFDTISDVHTVSPAHIEKYLTAAEVALNQAAVIGDMPWAVKDFPVDQLTYSSPKIKAGNFFMNGSATIPTNNLTPGIYKLKFTASSTQAGDEEAIMEVKDNDKSLTKVEIPHKTKHALISLDLELTKESKITISYINDYREPAVKNKKRKDRNIRLHTVTLQGPLDGKRPPKPLTHRKLFPPKLVSQTDESYALEIWKSFANRAFRRPVILTEIQPYTRLLTPSVTTKEDLQRQILLGMQAMLSSPHFLYIKSTPEQNDMPVSPISEIALASRLSYFLWSSMPDETLIAKANQNQLRANLTEEINRMLDDTKAERFIQNFGGQWLQLRNLEISTPDHSIFPKWSKSIKEDATQETLHFLRHLLHTESNILDCIDASYSFINENLAKLYQINGVEGDHFRKVTFENGQRGGLLTQIAILTLTSHPDRTSPVLRGKWILENILGTAPPPPPGDIPSLEPNSEKNKHVSLRKELEAHRKKAECAACHNLLDPLGFTLENYNAMGEWRLTDNGQPIDSFGKLITGESFKDSTEMKSVLRKYNADEFLNCLTEKLLTYGLGRGLEYYDSPAVNNIIATSKENHLTLRSLIHAICRSTPFQMTRTSAYKGTP